MSFVSCFSFLNLIEFSFINRGSFLMGFLWHIVLSFILLVQTPAYALNSYADLVEDLMPSVVNISSKIHADKETQPLKDMKNPFEGTPFEGFFDGFQHGLKIPKRQQQAVGSGVLISVDGYIITNNHVVTGADEVFVKFNDDRKEYEAEVIGQDTKNDLALLKLKDKKRYPAAKLGDSDKVRIGDGVLAIGNPFGLGGSVTAGIVSQMGRNIGQGPYDDFIQTDAAINPGNSGGPLFNNKGEVIGINTAILTRNGGSNGIGFAVPINTVRLIVDQLKEHGRPLRGWLGVMIQKVTPNLAESLGLKEDIGALVSQVAPESPAEKAGIKTGDVITHFNRTEIEEMSDLPKLVAETPIGEKTEIYIIRNGKRKTLLVRIAELEEDQDFTLSKKNKKMHKNSVQGMQLSRLTESLRERYGIEKKVKGLFVMGVVFNSAAAKAGIHKGDVLVEANWESLPKVSTLRDVIEEQGDKAILMRLYRAGGYLFVPLKAE